MIPYIPYTGFEEVSTSRERFCPPIDALINQVVPPIRLGVSVALVTFEISGTSLLKFRTGSRSEEPGSLRLGNSGSALLSP